MQLSSNAIIFRRTTPFYGIFHLELHPPYSFWAHRPNLRKKKALFRVPTGCFLIWITIDGWHGQFLLT